MPWSSGSILVALAIVIGGCADRGPATPDASPSSDASPDADVFTCGSPIACDPQSQYCYSIAAGLLAHAATGCTAIPSTCQASPTCDCITNAVSDCAGALSCQSDRGRITVTCALP